MPLDLPLALLVSLFLTLFVLIGLYPALQRAAAKFRKLLNEAAQDATKEANPLAAPLATLLGEEPGAPPSGPPPTHPLNDFELIVLRRIAQEGGKALSLRQLQTALLFDKATLHQTLRALMQRRLIGLKISPLLGQRFALSKTGQDYALEQGYLVQIQTH